MRRWMFRVLAAAVVVTSVVAAIGFAYPLLTGRTYLSEATLIYFDAPQPNDLTLGPGLATSSDFDRLERFGNNQIVILTSEPMLRKAIQWPTVRNSKWYSGFNGDIRRAADSLAGHLDARLVPESTFMEVSVTLSNPAEAQDVLNALVEVYLQERSVSTNDEEALLNSVVQHELERADRTILRLRTDMKQFIGSHDWVGVEPIRLRMTLLQERLIDAELEARVLQNAMAQAEKQTDTEADGDAVLALEQAKDHLKAMSDLLVKTHAELRDALSVEEQLRMMEADMDDARADYRRAEEQLATLRALYRRPDISRVGRHKPPTEAQRVWWVWPW